MDLAPEPGVHSGSSPVRVLVAGHRWPSGPCPLQPAQCMQDTTGQEGAVSAACSSQKNRFASNKEEPLQSAGTMAQGLQSRDSFHQVLCPAHSAMTGEHGPGALPSQGRRCLVHQGHNSCRAPLPWPQSLWSRAWQVKRYSPALFPCSETCGSPVDRPRPALAVPTQTLCSTSRMLTSPCTRLGVACALGPADSCI